MNTKTILLAATVLAAAGTSAAAWAQSAPQQQAQAATPAASNAAAAPDEIIVTARRRSEAISHVPVAVTAFDTQAMLDKGIEDTFDLTKVTPGFNFRLQGARTAPILTIRGQTRATGGGGVPGVLVYQNDVPLPTYGTFVPTFDMANLQVLKGPQGTLFGRNAIGGALLLNTAPPTHKFGGYAEFAFGSNGNKRVEGAVNVPINDKFAIRLAGQYDYQGSYTNTVYYSDFTVGPTGVTAPGHVTSGRPADEFTTKAIRGSVLIEPSDSIRNVTVADWTRVSGSTSAYPATLVTPPPIFLLPTATLSSILQLGGTPAATADFFAQNVSNLLNCPSGAVNCNIAAAVAAAQANPRTELRNSPGPAYVNLWGVTNTTTVDLTPRIAAKNIFGFRQIKNSTVGDVDGTPEEYIEAGILTNYRTLTDELQLSGNLTDELKFVTGGFYYNTKPTGLGGQEASHVILFGGFLNQSEVHYIEDSSKAVYGQVDYDLSRWVNGLSLTAGFRETWDESKGCIASYSFFPFGGPGTGSFGYAPTYAQCTSNTFADLPADALPVDAHSYDVKSSKGTYTFSANYQFTPETLVYVTTRRGYREGEFNFGKVPTPAFNGSLQFYGPETLTDYELGLKTRFQSGDLSGNLDAAGFTGKDHNYQFQVSTTGVCNPPGSASCLPLSGLILNVADLRISGVEAASNLKYGGFTVGGNMAYTKVSVIKSYLPQAFIDAYTAALGANPTLPPIAISNSPKWQLNANIGYELPMEVAGGTLSVDFNLHHQTSYLTTDVVVPAWTTVDGQITLDELAGRPISVRFYARNLLDTTYYVGSASNAASTGIFSYVRGAPREFGLSLRYKFGEQ